MNLATPKLNLVSDRKWLDSLRDQPCIVTGSDQCEPAHIRWGQGGGMGMKPGDDRAVSLDAGLHHQQHQMGEVPFWLMMANEHPHFLMEQLIQRAELAYRMNR